MKMSIELKYSWRMLVKKPIFTFLTVMIVAIGLGLTVYSYSLLASLVFKPLYMYGDQKIVALEGAFDHNHLFRRSVDPYHVNLATKKSAIFQEHGFYGETTTILSGGSGKYAALQAAKKVNATYTSQNAFSLAGVQPMLGRAFSDGDTAEGAEPVVILSHKIWRNYFNSDPEVINQPVSMDATQGRIIGVMPEGFSFPEIAEVWRPLSDNLINPTEASYTRLFTYARLSPGVSVDDAQVALDAFNKELATTIDEKFKYRIRPNGDYLLVQPFKHASITQYYNVFVALFIVVFLILLLACINVSNLLLSRVNERIKEVAIRLALGIPRKKLVLQMLWESIFICTLGGLLALLFAGYGVELTNQMFDDTFAVNNEKPFWWHINIDLEAIGILCLSIILMVLITGLYPAYKALGSDFNAVIRDGTRGALSKKAAFKGKVLVVSEIVLSCVVLVVATILLSTGYSASQADYGVETDSRITAQIQLSSDKYPIRRGTEFELADRRAKGEVFSRIQAQIKQQPNVLGVSLMSELPGRGGGTSYFEIEGRAAEVYNENPYSNNEVVGDKPWEALGMQLIQGRDFDHRDNEPEAFNYIINESIANTFFPDGDAIGKRVRRVGRGYTDDQWWTIIGVVSDTFHGSTMRSSSASYNTYASNQKLGFGRLYAAIHYTGSEAAMVATLNKSVTDVDPEAGVYHVQSYDDLIAQPMLLLLSVSKIFLFCGIIAAILAASGIYAMASNNILQRTQEIGVRRAVGAPDSKIMSMFFKQATWQLVIGLILGVALANTLVSYMSNTLVVNQQSYIIGIIGVPLLIITMVVLATYIPIKQILKLEPSDALHYD